MTPNHARRVGRCHRRKSLLLAPQLGDAACYQHPTQVQIEALSESVIELANANSALIVSERHLLLREIDASPWRVERRGGAFGNCTYQTESVEGCGLIYSRLRTQ